MRILWVFAILPLGGCAGSLLGDAIAGPEKLAQQDAAYCASIGAPAGTPSHPQCRMNLEQQRTAHHQASAAVMAAGLTLMAQPPPPPPQPPPDTRLFCRPDGNGNYHCQ
jgi:hypothetical protein